MFNFFFSLQYAINKGMAKKTVKIPIWMYTEEISLYISIRRKRKLTDLYPQRAILEERRKESSLIQANDWIDHDYYEKKVEESEANMKALDRKYGTRIPDRSKEKPKSLGSYKVRNVE